MQLTRSSLITTLSICPNEASHHPALALATRRKPRNRLGNLSSRSNAYSCVSLKTGTLFPQRRAASSSNFLPRVGGAVIFTFAEVTFTPPSPKSARPDGVLDYIILGSGHIMRNHIPTAVKKTPTGPLWENPYGAIYRG